MQRFFENSNSVNGKTVIMRNENAHHISHSLRMRAGEQIVVCVDGKALICELKSFGADFVTAEIIGEEAVCPEMPVKIHVYQALPKSDKFEMVVQKSVECGVYSITPFISSRCIAKPNEGFDKKLVRYNKIAKEAAMQSGRTVIPKVNFPLSFEAMLSEALKSDIALFCYEGENTHPIGQCLRKDVSSVSIIVGSEGGFSFEEAESALRAGAVLTGLGPRILRCETAPLFVLSCLSFYFELGI